jgi:predicted 3-demethylubiquinone-9 3-methyltransferase (glyoxalase superfamily)
MASLQKITPHIWYSHEAEEAANYYVSIFNDSRIGRITRYGSEGKEIHKMEEGTVMTVEFELDGQSFIALNGGPLFLFNESISFMIHCNTQDEIDYYWEKLKEGGDEKAQQCGWLKDKFGLSWQVSPKVLADMLHDHDSAAAQRVMKVMLQMKKLDIAKLQAAYDGA